MKKFIVLICFAIGMFAMLPSTSSGNDSPPGQSSFISDQFVDVAAMVTDVIILNVEQNASVSATPMICREGGDVVIQEAISDQRHLYLYSGANSTNVNLNKYVITDFRLANFERFRNHNIQRNNVADHRFARDGLTCRV